MQSKNLLIFVIVLVILVASTGYFSYSIGFSQGETARETSGLERGKTIGYDNGYERGKAVGIEEATVTADEVVSNPLEDAPDVNPFEASTNPSEGYTNPFE